MILNDHDKIEIKSDNTNVEMSPLEDASDWDIRLRENYWLFNMH